MNVLPCELLIWLFVDLVIWLFVDLVIFLWLIGLLVSLSHYPTMQLSSYAVNQQANNPIIRQSN